MDARMTEPQALPASRAAVDSNAAANATPKPMSASRNFIHTSPEAERNPAPARGLATPCREAGLEWEELTARSVPPRKWAINPRALGRDAVVMGRALNRGTRSQRP